MVSEQTVPDVILHCVQGDITAQPDIDGIVNAANGELRSGGGVAGAVHRAAGPQLYQECRPLAPIKPGDAVITGAGDLPNRCVIHCLGPVWGRDLPEEQLLAACYRNALARAEEAGLGSLAFPAISTGVFGYPVREAAAVAFATIATEAPHLRSVRLIRFVLFSAEDLAVHREAMAAAGLAPAV